MRENVELAALSARRYRPRRAAPSTPTSLLADAGLADVAERPAATLDYGNQRRLELARAAALAPAYLLLDEPTSGMSDAESLAMVDHVRATAQLVGAGVLVIDHDLAFITRISDHVVVLAERPGRSPRARPTRSAPTPPSPRPTSAATRRPDPSVCCGASPQQTLRRTNTRVSRTGGSCRAPRR